MIRYLDENLASLELHDRQGVIRSRKAYGDIALLSEVFGVGKDLVTGVVLSAANFLYFTYDWGVFYMITQEGVEAADVALGKSRRRKKHLTIDFARLQPSVYAESLPDLVATLALQMQSGARPVPDGCEIKVFEIGGVLKDLERYRVIERGDGYLQFRNIEDHHVWACYAADEEFRQYMDERVVHFIIDGISDRGEAQEFHVKVGTDTKAYVKRAGIGPRRGRPPGSGAGRRGRRQSREPGRRGRPPGRGRRSDDLPRKHQTPQQKRDAIDTIREAHERLKASRAKGSGTPATDLEEAVLDADWLEEGRGEDEADKLAGEQRPDYEGSSPMDGYTSVLEDEEEEEEDTDLDWGSGEDDQ